MHKKKYVLMQNIISQQEKGKQCEVRLFIYFIKQHQVWLADI